mmetsp:Transcript_26565/g.40182  ORF Transcript_26565/g.40182 Transcript_26565/m.40182 type:complete len:134 (-) Transcript_26565:231-632(-)
MPTKILTRNCRLKRNNNLLSKSSASTGTRFLLLPKAQWILCDVILVLSRTQRDRREREDCVGVPKLVGLNLRCEPTSPIDARSLSPPDLTCQVTSRTGDCFGEAPHKATAYTDACIRRAWYAVDTDKTKSNRG